MEFPSPGPSPTSRPVNDDSGIVSDFRLHPSWKAAQSVSPKSPSLYLPVCDGFSCDLPSYDLPRQVIQSHPGKTEHQQHPLIYYMASFLPGSISHFNFTKINRFIKLSSRVWGSCTVSRNSMFLHGLSIGSLEEEEVIHKLKVKKNGEVWDRGDFLFFLPSCPNVGQVFCLFDFHPFMCGPFSRATWEIYLINSSCWEGKLQSKKLVALLITTAPFL